VACSIRLPLFVPGAQDPFDSHGESLFFVEATPGLRGSMAHRGESTLERVGGKDMHQVLGREIIETQPACTVLDQAFDKLVILHALGFNEEIKSALGSCLGLGNSACPGLP